jgi:hypothetical protein
MIDVLFLGRLYNWNTPDTAFLKEGIGLTVNETENTPAEGYTCFGAGGM